MAGAEREGYGTCLLFVPARPGPWLGEVIEVAQRTHMRMQVLVGFDSIAVKSARWQNLVFSDSEDVRVQVEGEALERIEQETRGLVACTCFVNRGTGQVDVRGRERHSEVRLVEPTG